MNVMRSERTKRLVALPLYDTTPAAMPHVWQAEHLGAALKLNKKARSRGLFRSPLSVTIATWLAYLRLPQKRWMRLQASSRSDVLVA
jgi:hypothetical protein